METADAESELGRQVLDAVKAAEERQDPPLLCAMEVGRRVRMFGMGVPSVELGQVLVDSLCFANNTPFMWKLLDQAITSGLVFPTHVLALLTARVLPLHQVQPEAYGLYLGLLGRHMFSFSLLRTTTPLQKLMKSVDDSLQLSSSYKIQVENVGMMIVLFTFSIIIKLLDSALKDHDLHLDTEKKNMVHVLGDKKMDVEENDKRTGRREILCRRNAVLALEIVERITAHRNAQLFIRLVHLYIRSEKFSCMMQRLQSIHVQETTQPNQMPAKNTLLKITTNITKAVDGSFWFTSNKLVGDLISLGTRRLSSCEFSGAGYSASWAIFDILLENVMDRRHLYPTSAIVVLKELTMTLQVVNQASWQETLEALWISALRLVKRGREYIDDPIPEINARLCILLALIPLVVCDLIKEEEVPSSFAHGSKCAVASCENQMERNLCSSIRQGLVSSLQQLQKYIGLLTPPTSVVAAANDAASKATSFLVDHRKRHGSFVSMADVGIPSKASGNMLHLVVEACISRRLIDTSAYFWPGYVAVSPASSTDSISVQESPWSKFMEGAELKGSLVNSLKLSPASSLDQVEKLYHIALNGPDDEKSAAAEILCGASLSQGWNIQEHVVHFVVKLLAPPMPSDFVEPDSHLFGYMPMLNSVLLGASSLDVVHIISLYGMVPALAVALMPLCEVFGSLPPTSSSGVKAKDDTSIYSVFSCAFLFLLRLWKFYRLPHEHGLGITNCWDMDPELTLDYLILMYNRSIVYHSSVVSAGSHPVTHPHNGLFSHPVSMDSFPKLKGWSIQNQACVSSTMSGTCSAKPAHQVTNKILCMMCQKMNKLGSSSATSSSPTSSNSMNNSYSSVNEDTFQKPLLPAWEILEAIPSVLEAILAACAAGRLSSRELTTGLRNLMDFLPASLAVITSYLAAEITRGIWKPVQMNGIDWPSPAANLASVESEIANILASAGVHIPSCYAGGKAAIMLPLPMAALLSLTITFRIDKTLEYMDGVTGQALETCVARCSWPSMPIVAALWAQKVRRLHDLIVSSCALYPFVQDRNAISQLLRSCFSSFLGASVTSGAHLSSQRGIKGLLDHTSSNHQSRLLAAPGVLYLRSCQSFVDIKFVGSEIIKLVSGYARELVSGWTCGGPVKLTSSQTSLTSAVTGAKEIAMLGASLLCICRGVRIAHLLYMDITPTWLLTKTDNKVSAPMSFILEGYTMAYTMLLCGLFAWSIPEGRCDVASKCTPRCRRAISSHLEFMAGVIGGGISVQCSPITWKAYVSCFLWLLLRFAPLWVANVKLEILEKLAVGLRGWHEHELALALLERGGSSVMESIVNMIL